MLEDSITYKHHNNSIMNNNDIFEELELIFRDVLDNESIKLNKDTCADEIEEWDSLAHIQLIDSIQKKFNIKFTAKEMLSWDNVGELVECIQTKLG